MTFKSATHLCPALKNSWLRACIVVAILFSVTPKVKLIKSFTNCQFQNFTQQMFY